MLAGNSDLLNVISLKFKDNFLSNPYQDVQFGVAGLYLFIFPSLISSLSLFISADVIFFLPLFDALELISSLLLSDSKSKN